MSRFLSFINYYLDASKESRNSWWRNIVNAFDNNDIMLGRTMLGAFRMTYGDIPFDPEASRGRRSDRQAELDFRRARRPRTESISAA